jgi:hypothetical protein
LGAQESRVTESGLRLSIKIIPKIEIVERVTSCAEVVEGVEARRFVHRVPKERMELLDSRSYQSIADSQSVIQVGSQSDA